jgi:hypothetical protein
MPRVGFEPTIPVFEWAKMVNALVRAATMIEGKQCFQFTWYKQWLPFSILLTGCVLDLATALRALQEGSGWGCNEGMKGGDAPQLIFCYSPSTRCHWSHEARPSLLQILIRTARNKKRQYLASLSSARWISNILLILQSYSQLRC